MITPMVFRVIVTHDSIEDDEHNYYGIVFPNRDIGQVKHLEYDSSNDRLEATFSFDEDKVHEGEKFLAILVPVNEDEITDSTSPQFKIGTNTKIHAPEVVHFP
jgi:hypothetical protein